MFSGADNRHKLILNLTLGITIVLGILIFINPGSLFPDPSWGFQVMRAMQQGYGFNNLPSPDPTNIAINKVEFLSWWSPGQYLAPYLIKAVLHTNTGRATALTISLCSIIGLLGYFALFKRLGFTPVTAAISVAFIACQNYFILPYVFYTGGEILLFAFAGWFLYGCFSINKINLKTLAFIFMAGMIGFFCKSSSLWLFAAGLACIWINISANSKALSEWIKNGILLAIPAICALAIIYTFYLSKGENPSSQGSDLLFTPETFTFPLASPLVAGFSLDELFNGFIYHADQAILTYAQSTVLLVVLTLLSLGYIIASFKFSPDKKYPLAITVLYAVGSLFFIYLYIKQASVSMEGRHYRIIGILTIPGIVYLADKTKISRIAFLLVWIAFFYWEIDLFRHDYAYNLHAARGISGFSQQGYDQSVLNEITKLDHTEQKAIFVIPSPDIGIEIQNNRVITLNIDDMDKEEFDNLKYAGYGGTIHLLMPATYIRNGTAEHLAKAFVNYSSFQIKQLSKGFYLYTAR